MSRFVFWHRSPQQKAAAPSRPGQRYRWLGGRRYLVGVPYALPKDFREVQRLDFQHFFLRHAMRGNYLAPIGQPASILDVGCGTGRWAMEMGAQFPFANVVGLDLVLPEDFSSTLGHGLERRPENVVFIEGNVLNGLPFAHASFDFVYMRLLFMGIPANDWPRVINELARVTRPGGWVESLETLRVGSDRSPAMKVIIEWGNELLKRRGLDPCIARRIPEMMRASGLIQVTTRELPKETQTRHGRSSRKTSGLAMIEHLKPQIVEQGIARAEEYDRVAARAKIELEQDKEPRGMPTYVTFGQRPPLT
jgi:ubiquinone/menaquinone biosynthesis C-methylase UbiE